MNTTKGGEAGDTIRRAIAMRGLNPTEAARAAGLSDNSLFYFLSDDPKEQRDVYLGTAAAVMKAVGLRVVHTDEAPLTERVDLDNIQVLDPSTTFGEIKELIGILMDSPSEKGDGEDYQWLGPSVAILLMIGFTWEQVADILGLKNREIKKAMKEISLEWRKELTPDQEK